MLGFHEGIERINVEIFPQIKAELEQRQLIVIISAPGLGKTTLAKNSLPSARYVSGHAIKSIESKVVACDLIAEELHWGIAADKFINYRNAVLENKCKVIITGQHWNDVAPYLVGLEIDSFRAFDLNKIWDLSPVDAVTGIPENALAN